MPSFSTLLTKHNITAIAIGHFDGVHRGHKQLLRQLGTYGGLVVVDKNIANITPRLKRAEYSNYPCFIYEFEEIKALSGPDFVELLLHDFTNLNKIVVGYDFRFGRGRAWDKYDLKSLFCGDVVIVPEYCYEGVGVHSSSIREYIKQGNIIMANRLLGREYSTEGIVIKGQGIGKNELVPTLNLEFLGYLTPAPGVYASRTKIGYKTYASVTFVGNRVSTDNKFSIETHIINENIIQTPRIVSVCFIEKIRENMHFDTLEKLKIQIYDDIKKAAEYTGFCELNI